MELNQFISGEKFQALADISFIPYGNEVGESECDFVKVQQVNNNYNVFYYHEDSKIPNLNAVKTIFVNTWTLPNFFRVIFPQLKGKYNFISHNSDMGLTDSCKHILDSEIVIKWYSQNKDIDHSKAFSLPIGLGNQQYNHGNVSLLNKIIEIKNYKTNLVFKNFSTNTNVSKRSIVDFITHKNGIYMSKQTNQEGYFDAISKSMFCISPPGNGIDCHRIWECLYLKTIPVVEYNAAFKEFTHLPILFVNDWNIVTPEFLMSKVTMQDQFNKSIPELIMNYWKGKIL